MMIKKKRMKSMQQLALEALDKRMLLPNEEKYHLLNIQKGFVGESNLDATMLETLNIEAIVLNDLLFTNKGSTFQVDSFLITGAGNFLLEVKNYEGDFQFHNGKFLTYSGEELTNPLTKLSITSTKMSHLLKSWNVRASFDSKLLFVNSQCMIYNAPANRTVVYPPQVARFFAKLNQQPLPLTKADHYLADKLLLEHQSEAAFSRKLPEYTYGSLKKGMWCMQCGVADLKFSQRSCTCQACGYKATVDDILIFHAEEFKLLFPREKMTRNILHDWIGGALSLKKVWNTLQKNYTPQGSASSTYYM